MGTTLKYLETDSWECWLTCLATSRDLINWEKKGPVLDFGEPGEMDHAAACSPWVIQEGDLWYMFFLGTPNASTPPDLVPSFPYLTLKAKAKRPAGPWMKQKDVVPFSTSHMKRNIGLAWLDLPLSFPE
jgi:hypothetical protein